MVGYIQVSLAGSTRRDIEVNTEDRYRDRYGTHVSHLGGFVGAVDSHGDGHRRSTVPAFFPHLESVPPENVR
jgi:hypothetical protein